VLQTIALIRLSIRICARKTANQHFMFPSFYSHIPPHIAYYCGTVFYLLLSFPKFQWYDNLSSYQEEKKKNSPHFGGTCRGRPYHPYLPRPSGHLHLLLPLNAMEMQEERVRGPLALIFKDACLDQLLEQATKWHSYANFVRARAQKHL
jgi:hypothetical protein